MVTKLEQLKEWAKQNVTLIDLLPNNNGLQVTTRLIDVLEDEVDEKYYLSDEKTKKLTLDKDLGGKLNMYDYNERDKVHSIEKVSPTLNTMQGGDRQPKIAVKGFKEIVNVRKYEVDVERLKVTLRHHKNLSNKQIAEKLNVAVTKVEHWFRKDKSFAIPDKDIWCQLKDLLNIETDEFDLSITTFIEKESEFDTTNRIYDVGYLSPTLNTTSEPKVAVLGNTSNTGYGSHDSVNVSYPTSKTRRGRVGKQVAQTLQAGEVNQGVVTSNIRIRKLTPLECWRLQGFTDEQFYKAKNDGVSNSQLYKQSGNSVTVNVVDAIVSCL